MAIDLQMLGAKLVKYRDQLQESPEEVATSTGIEFGRLIAIEAGTVTKTLHGEQLPVVTYVIPVQHLPPMGMAKRKSQPSTAS